jgi:hypothetical protein
MTYLSPRIISTLWFYIKLIAFFNQVKLFMHDKNAT